jgi:hypothetical protein
MVLKQWMYRDHRIDLHLIGADFLSDIYDPGTSQKLAYTPIVEMKHGQQEAERAAETFIDARIEKRTKPL